MPSPVPWADAISPITTGVVVVVVLTAAVAPSLCPPFVLVFSRVERPRTSFGGTGPFDSAENEYEVGEQQHIMK